MCHLSWLKKLSPTHTHPLIYICEFLKPYELLFSELESLVKCELGKNSLNNFICHLSWLEKLSPAHTHPLKTIHEFSKPYELLFSELESLVKCNHKIRVQECYGAELCLAHDMGGVEAYGGPLSVDMQPFGCFI